MLFFFWQHPAERGHDSEIHIHKRIIKAANGYTPKVIKDAGLCDLPERNVDVKEQINGEKEKDSETAGTNRSGQSVEIQTDNR